MPLRPLHTHIRLEDYDESFESYSSEDEEQSRVDNFMSAYQPVGTKQSLHHVTPLKTPISTAEPASEQDVLSESICSDISWADASSSGSVPSLVATEASISHASPRGMASHSNSPEKRLRLVLPGSPSSTVEGRHKPKALDGSFWESCDGSPSTSWSTALNGTLRHRPTGTCFSSTRGITYAGHDYKLSVEDIEMDFSARLGSGACGVVTKGIIRQSGVPVAVKSIKVHDKERREQLLNEIRTLVRATGCPNLVQWYAGFVSMGNVLVALEFMDMGSLADLQHRLPQGSGLPQEHLATVAAQVMRGLTHLHDNNHIHRDIKPQNVLHNRMGEVKLTDFGIAKELSDMALACTFVGTAMYMAPERCLGKDYSFNSDIWSAGMVLFELAAGKYPFVANSFPALVDCLCEQKEPRLETALFPSEAVDFVAKCLTRDNMHRPSSEVLMRHTFVAMGCTKESRGNFSAWLSTL